MSNQHEKLDISHNTKLFIVDNLVEPYYKDMVKTTINGKKWWRNLGITFETSSKLMVALGGIFSFSAGFYHNDTLSFVSGSISCMSLALLQIASFSYKENKKQGDELNILLKKLNLDTVPSLMRSEDQMMLSSPMSPQRQTETYARRSSFVTANLPRTPVGDTRQFNAEENKLYQEDIRRREDIIRTMHVDAIMKAEEEARQQQMQEQEINEISGPRTAQINNNIDFVTETKI